MSQSEWLGAVLIAGFLVWLAMNQRLGAYWSILLGGGAAAAAPAAPAVTAPPAGNPSGIPASPGTAPAQGGFMPPLGGVFSFPF